eukprot:9103312-Prorocentrum_lima.AAC.1
MERGYVEVESAHQLYQRNMAMVHNKFSYAGNLLWCYLCDSVQDLRLIRTDTSFGFDNNMKLRGIRNMISTNTYPATTSSMMFALRDS